MPRTLALESFHRERAKAFVEAWGWSVPAHFSSSLEEYAATRERVGVLDQSYRGFLDLELDSGEPGQVGEFLQRLVSTHASALDESLGEESSLLSARGRLLGAFQLFRLGENRFRVVLSEPARPELISAFDKYAFLDDISIVDRSDEIALLAVAGPLSRETLLELVDGALPEVALERTAVAIGDVAVGVVFASESAEEGFELWVPWAEAQVVWSLLLDAVTQRGGQSVGWEASEALRIERGVTRYDFDYDEERFPPEVNQGHRLTYDKCYVGQEVVARMRTYGQANRRLFHVRPRGGCDAADLVSGASILCGEKEAGRITSVRPDLGDAKPLAIGLIKRKYWQDSELTMDAAVPLEISELPQQGHPSSEE